MKISTKTKVLNISWSKVLLLRNVASQMECFFIGEIKITLFLTISNDDHPCKMEENDVCELG